MTTVEWFPRFNDVKAVPDSDLELALRHVEGVEQAAIEPDTDGGWGLLNLALAPDADETAVAVAVGHLLADQFGLGVDVAALALVEDVMAMPPVGGLSVEALHLSTGVRQASCRVALHGAAGSSEGVATGPGGGELVDLVAEATLRAAAELDPALGRAAVDSVQMGTSADGPVVRVVLTGVGAGKGRRVVGKAALVSDPRQAAARAVLRAVGAATEAGGQPLAASTGKSR